MVVLCSITATDATSGAPVHAAVAYSNAEADTRMLERGAKGESGRPQLHWDAKFKDMLSFSSEGRVMCDMDNLARVVSNRSLRSSSTLVTATITDEEDATRAGVHQPGVPSSVVVPATEDG